MGFLKKKSNNSNVGKSDHPDLFKENDDIFESGDFSPPQSQSKIEPDIDVEEINEGEKLQDSALKMLEKFSHKQVIDNITDEINNIKQEVSEELYSTKYSRNVFGFVSLNCGAGSKTISSSVAVELSKKGSVCIIDFDLVNPGICHILNTHVEEKNSLSKFFSSNIDPNKCYIKVDGVDKLKLVSNCPLNDPLDIAEIDEELFRKFMEYTKKTFDYVIMNIPYIPYSEAVIFGIQYLEHGYIVWDENLDCSVKTRNMLNFINRATKKANKINNVILNKVGKRAYNEANIKDSECNFVVGIPYTGNVLVSRNEGKILGIKGNVDRNFSSSISYIVEDLLAHQNMGELIR